MPDIDLGSATTGGALGPFLVCAVCVALAFCAAIACTRGLREATCHEGIFTAHAHKFE